MSSKSGNWWTRFFGVDGRTHQVDMNHKAELMAAADARAKDAKTMADADARAEAQAKTEADTRAEAKAKAEVIGKASLEEVLNIVDELVRQHGSVLITKRRQKTYRDDYGLLVDEAWKSEIEYFRLKVVEDELMRRCGVEKVAQASVQFFYEMPEKSREAIGLKGDYFEDYLNTYIGIIVEDLDASTPTQPIDNDQLSPNDYEHLCADALRAAGWSVRICGGTGDQGVDLVADVGDVRAVFQCKLYTSPVGNGAVQEVYTGKTFHSAQLAAVVSTAGFTPAARAAATQTGVFLLHHSELAEFPKERE